MSEPQPGTYWNGQPTTAARGTAVVADTGLFPLYWARKKGLVGKRIPVVMVKWADTTMYLDNRDGSGWLKVTEGGGSPRYRHRAVQIERGSFELDGLPKIGEK